MTKNIIYFCIIPIFTFIKVELELILYIIPSTKLKLSEKEIVF